MTERLAEPSGLNDGVSQMTTANSMTVQHRRYDSDEFDYSGCEVCDANGDTLGWPCPTIKAMED